MSVRQYRVPVNPNFKMCQKIYTNQVTQVKKPHSYYRQSSLPVTCIGDWQKEPSRNTTEQNRNCILSGPILLSMTHTNTHTDESKLGVTWSASM